MPVLNIYKLDGTQSGTIELNDETVNVNPNNDAKREENLKSVMHEVLVAELAELREGSASTKTRAEVRGGGRKPLRQKGTGKARQGSIRAPHMVGGGVVHGPKPRSYTKKINKKVRKLALKAALATKVKEGNLLVLDDFVLDVPKTKTFVNFAKAMNFEGEKQLFVVDYSENTYERDTNLDYSVRNIPKIEAIYSKGLSIYWLLKQTKIILTKEALTAIEEVLV